MRGRVHSLVSETLTIRRRSMTTPLLLLLMLVTVTACSGDDDAAPTTAASMVVSSTTDATTPATTVPASTLPVPTSPVTTELAPPTTSLDDLKAVIAADVEAAALANYDFLVDPSVEALPAHLAAVAVPGSPVEASLTRFVNELVSLGDGIIPGDPDILKVIVEQVELVGEPPYTMALVTICEVDNRPQATLSKNTSDGRIIYVEGTGDLQALRGVQDVRLTPAGWRLYDSLPDGGFLFPGEDKCLPV